MPKTAQPLAPVTILVAYKFEADHWIETDCQDYADFRVSPRALSFEGRIYGRTGWDSDKCKAYYATRQAVAQAV